MRWLVEVSSIGNTDLQKHCVDAESWQRALQAARAARGEEGPMSGFSIELLEEGYRAVDPLARLRFVVKRAPDDMPLTITASAKDSGKTGVAPTPPSATPPAKTESKGPPRPAADGEAKAKDKKPRKEKESAPPRKGPPRPGQSAPPPAEKPAAPEKAVAAERPAAEKATAEKATVDNKAASGSPAPIAAAPAAASPAPADAAARAKVPPVGSTIPGLPPVKLLIKREQEPSEASPLAYREYAFAVPEGTTDEAAADVVRAQLELVEAHLAGAKHGKLVNLAVFDVEFQGKPPRPPLVTLTWKSWKNEPVIAFPRKTGVSRPPRPPTSNPSPDSLSRFISSPTTQPLIPAAAPSAPVVEEAAPTTHRASVAPPANNPPAQAAAPHAPAASQPQPPPPAPQQPRSQPPPQPQQPQPFQPPPAATNTAPMVDRPAFPVPPTAQPAPVVTEAAAAPAKRPSQPPAGMVKTPSGRFVRGRVSGDELITALFESMHDLHFLRDALDGGQFCLALATEVLPARAALIHFFDIEKREWVCACTRGKETHKLLTSRAPENDEVLLGAARRRRAVVHAHAAEKATAARYQHLGGARSVVVAPIMQAGRALGAIEIVNPLDGMPFTDDEGNAMTYIAEQYAEYLGSRGIVLDRERITQQASAAR